MPKRDARSDVASIASESGVSRETCKAINRSVERLSRTTDVDSIREQCRTMIAEMQVLPWRFAASNLSVAQRMAFLRKIMERLGIPEVDFNKMWDETLNTLPPY